MGYYVEGNGHNGWGPMFLEKNKEIALKEFNRVMMNPRFISQNARGGSFSGGKCTDQWYSWCDMEFLRNATDIYDVLEHFGFHLEVVDGNIHHMWYDNKTGQEDLLLETIGHFFEDGAVIEWKGEDGTMWLTELRTGKQKNGRVIYD